MCMFSRIFSVKPSKGLLAGQHQIFVVKVTPAEVKIYKQALKMRLNDDEKHSQVYCRLNIRISICIVSKFTYFGTYF